MLSRTQILLAFAAGVLSTPLLAQQPSSAKLEIEIKNFTFTPNRLVVQQGDTITWTNRDFVRHDITAADKSWKVDTILSRATGSFTAAKPGTFDYICSRHPSMKGTIVVEAPKSAPPG